MAKQLVVAGNRILAHGEDCFLSMGGTVVCTKTDRAFQNATVVNYEGELPADIDSVGYEYHAGEFVPCAPFGEGDGNIAVLCKDACKALKDSGVALSFLQSLKRVQLVSYTGTGSASDPTAILELDFTPAGLIAFDRTGLSISINGKGIYISNESDYPLDWFTGLFDSSYNNKKDTAYQAIAFEGETGGV